MLTIWSGSSELHDTPIAFSSMPLTLCDTLDVGARDRFIPTALSEDMVLSPSICLSHPGLAALAQALMTEEVPKAVIVPHTMPAAPRFPRMRSPAVLDPIRVVSAAISTRPFPKLKDGKREAAFLMFG